MLRTEKEVEQIPLLANHLADGLQRRDDTDYEDTWKLREVLEAGAGLTDPVLGELPRKYAGLGVVRMLELTAGVDEVCRLAAEDLGDDADHDPQVLYELNVLQAAAQLIRQRRYEAARLSLPKGQIEQGRALAAKYFPELAHRDILA